MKIAAFVFLSTVACAMAQGESWHSSELKFGDLGDFKLENGAIIRDCRIAYHTSGKLNDDKSNVVLWPTWFTGSSKQLIPLAGSDGYVDPSRYFVIFVDALGNGISSSPSNSSVQPRMEFPVFTIRDMVNSQYRLLTENLGINHIHAVMGISMGGMQTFQWIVSYPEFMDKAVAIVGSPRLTAYDMLLWRAEESAIREDKDWNGGVADVAPRLFGFCRTDENQARSVDGAGSDRRPCEFGRGTLFALTFGVRKTNSSSKNSQKMPQTDAQLVYSAPNRM
jgi:homoserine acetyltransferase